MPESVRKSYTWIKRGELWNVEEVRALLDTVYGELTHLAIIGDGAGGYELHVQTEHEKWNAVDEEEV